MLHQSASTVRDGLSQKCGDLLFSFKIKPNIYGAQTINFQTGQPVSIILFFFFKRPNSLIYVICCTYLFIYYTLFYLHINVIILECLDLQLCGGV